MYELPGLEREPKLFGSERMVDCLGHEVEDWKYGDWNWDVLFLMQDAAPCDHITAWIGVHPDPFSARNFREEPKAGGAQSNRNLHELASHLRCRKLTGSALIGILKPGTDYSGPVGNLLDCPHVSSYCNGVLRWVLDEEKTEKSKTICCLGGPAFNAIAELLSIGDDERHRLTCERGALARIGKFNVAYLWHPRYWPPRRYFPPGGRIAAKAAWKRMATEAGLDWRA